MNCGDAAALLTRLMSSGGSAAPVSLTGPEEVVIRELIEKGFAARLQVEPIDPEEVARVRVQLADSQRREEEARRDLSKSEVLQGSAFKRRNEFVSRLAALAREQALLRSRVLDLAEGAARVLGSAKVDGERVAVTFRGKELVAALGPRLSRVGYASIDEFEAALARLREAFAQRASRASQILRLLSPAIPWIEEIHLRSAAVGLSVREEPPGAIAAAYPAAVESLGARFAPVGPEAVNIATLRPLVAETICVSAPSLEIPAIYAAVQTFTSLWERIVRSAPTWAEDALRAAMMLVPLGDRRESVLQDAIAFARAARGASLDVVADIATSIVVVQSGQGLDPSTVDRYRSYFAAVRSPAVPEKDLALAAALLTSGGGTDPGAAVQRYGVAREYLSRFNGDGMSGPAAMLAVLSAQLEESLDNLRLASAEIAKYRLSLGGMENLSLGMKLLLETAVLPSPVRGIVSPQGALAPPEQPPSAPLGLLGVAFATPFLMLPALAAFHETALHRLAVSDYAFHPVHANYVYG